MRPEWRPEGLALAAAGWLQIGLAILLFARPSRPALRVTCLANVAFIAAWVVPRGGGSLSVPRPAWSTRRRSSTSPASARGGPRVVGYELLAKPASAPLSSGAQVILSIIPVGILVLTTAAIASPSAPEPRHMGGVAAGHSHGGGEATATSTTPPRDRGRQGSVACHERSRRRWRTRRTARRSSTSMPRPRPGSTPSWTRLQPVHREVPDGRGRRGRRLPAHTVRTRRARRPLRGASVPAGQRRRHDRRGTSRHPMLIYDGIDARLEARRLHVPGFSSTPSRARGLRRSERPLALPHQRVPGVRERRGGRPARRRHRGDQGAVRRVRRPPASTTPATWSTCGPCPATSRRRACSATSTPDHLRRRHLLHDPQDQIGTRTNICRDVKA